MKKTRSRFPKKEFSEKGGFTHETKWIGDGGINVADLADLVQGMQPVDFVIVAYAFNGCTTYLKTPIHKEWSPDEPVIYQWEGLPLYHLEHFRRLCRLLKSKSTILRMVLGASSEVWRYQNGKGYDNDVVYYRKVAVEYEIQRSLAHQ